MKKYIIVIGLFLIGLFFMFNNDFIYSDTIIKISQVKTLESYKSTNSLGLEEIYLKQEISGVATNGKYKGQEFKIDYEETFSSVVSEKYHAGDKVFLKEGNIDGLKRDVYVYLMASFFVIALFLVAAKTGLFSVLTVAFNTTIFYICLSLYFKGINLFLICMIEIIVFTCFSLILVSGFNKKTLSAITSVILSVILLILITFLVSYFTDYSGINYNELEFLTVPIEDVLFVQLIIGGIGAIMDIAITMSSSISELIDQDSNISVRNLLKSGREIGQDVMGTMVNVLFFTYLCSGLPILVLAVRNGYGFFNYITSNFSLEITRFLVGSIGIVLAIPVSLFIAIRFFKGGIHE